MDWVLRDDGDLFYGKRRINIYSTEVSSCKPYLKISRNNSWAAVVHNNTVDIYGDPPHENFYKYSLRFDPYKTHGKYHIFEFFEDKFAMSRVHGSLSVCDSGTGQVSHTDEWDDKFFIKSKTYGDFLIVHGYYWGAGDCMFLYKVTDLLTTPDYEPRRLFIQNEKKYTLTDDGVMTLAPDMKYSTSFTLHEVYGNIDLVHDTLHDIDMTLLTQTEDFKKSVLWKLIAEPEFFTNKNANFQEETRQKLAEILTSGNLVHTECIGNVSGRVCRYFIRCLLEKIPTEERRLNRLMFLTIFGVSPAEHDIKELNYHILFDDKIKMNVYQRFARNEETGKYRTDDSCLCEIDVTYI